MCGYYTKMHWKKLHLKVSQGRDRGDRMKFIQQKLVKDTFNKNLYDCGKFY